MNENLKDLTVKQWAERLNKREYGKELTEDEEIALASAGIVVMFGYSDNNMELRGVINEEVSCRYDGGVIYFEEVSCRYDGGVIYFDENGLLENECGDEGCPYFEAAQEMAVTVTVSDIPWAFETRIPHETFVVMERGERYGDGIVFSLADLKEAVRLRKAEAGS